MNPQHNRPKRRNPHKGRGKTKRRRAFQQRPISRRQPSQSSPRECAVDTDLFEKFRPTPADTQAIGPASVHHWARYKWHATPLKRAPWGSVRLRLWLEVEATESYGKLPLPERKIFFAWWRWKREAPRRVKRVQEGNVFYTDERGRIRVFWA